MNISCHGCQRQFRVRRDRLPARGARTRCPRCDEVLVIPPQGDAPERPATPAREEAARPADGDLFELPPADLQPVDSDPVFTADETAAPPPAPPSPLTAEPAAAPVEWADEPVAEPAPPRRGGLRGWLSRLFGRDA
jgi:predicted Zn finger-like uncharacterized protein